MSTKKTTSYKEKFNEPEMGLRIKLIRGDLTQDNFAKLLGTTQATIARYEKGMMPKGDILMKLSVYSGKNINWIRHGGENIITMADGKILADDSPLEIQMIPLLGSIPAGFPLYVAEEVIDWVAHAGLPTNAYALRIKGDSMPPLIEGDYVAFVQNGDYRHGDRVVAHNEWGEFMIKRLRIKADGGQVLTSDNPNYPDVEPNEHFRIIGKVIKAWRDII